MHGFRPRARGAAASATPPIDTQSDETSPTSPSTERQFDLLRLLVDELAAIGAADVRAHRLRRGPRHHPRHRAPAAPTIGLLAHVDTAPQFNATGVRPVVHRGYDGGSIRFPDAPDLVLSPEQSPYLAEPGRRRHRHRQRHHAARRRRQGRRRHRHDRGPPPPRRPRHRRTARSASPSPPTRRSAAASTPTCPSDLGADVAYTLDGGDRGEIDFETFSADKAVVEITGVSIHPGLGQGQARQRPAPRRQDRRHPAAGHPHPGDHRRPPGLHPPLRADGHRRRGRAPLHPARLRARRPRRPRRAAPPGLRRGRGHRAAGARSTSPSPRSTATCATGSRTTCARSSSPARPAASAGVEPFSEPIRGGTDGSRLTEMGVPCPEPLHRHAEDPRPARMGQRPGHGRRHPRVHPPRRALGRRAAALTIRSWRAQNPYGIHTPSIRVPYRAFAVNLRHPAPSRVTPPAG